MQLDLPTVCINLGVALALGLLVGLQRERSASAVAGIRTFAFIALLGGMIPLLADLTTQPLAKPVLIAAGLICVLGLAYIGNLVRVPSDASPGVTTEVAMLVVFAAGVLCGMGEVQVAAIIGGVTTLLLHLKPSLQRFSRGLSDDDVRAAMQFVVITLIILPVVPDKDLGPFNAINPHHMWLLVVLVVGISLAAYVVQRVWGQQRGLLLAGVLGGLVSSTATTAALARRTREHTSLAGIATSAIFLATSVLYVRVLVELYIVAPALLAEMLVPIGVLLALCLASAGLAYAMGKHEQSQTLPQLRNPAELKGAIVFALLFAVVQVLSAGAYKWMGETGYYAVAAVSGLTDLDAITLSTGRLQARGAVGIEQATTAIAIALASNLAFKIGLAGVLSSGLLGRRFWTLGAVNLAACAGVVAWMAWTAK
jgi:uncharacterized membrane protein (DUF4010 family)